jgi:low temperature requirement protein LtrA
MNDRQAEREQRVTPLELFFDLVVVFAITQVTGFLSRDPTCGGLLRGLLLLGALWWAWGAYAWLTNTLDPEEGAVRLAVFAAIGAMLVVSLAVPGAFGAESVTFGVAYLVVRALHLVLYAIAGRGDRDLLRAVIRIVPTATVAPALLVIAGFLDGPEQLALWGAALAIDYLGPLMGGMRGWRISPAHFVERFGLIIIIALGESIVAIGLGAAGLPLDPRGDRGRPPGTHRRRLPLVVVFRLGHLRCPSSVGRGDRRGARGAREGCVLVPAPADGCGHRPVRVRVGDHPP